MNDIEYQFTLNDRLVKIQTTIEQYGEENFYISYSGGKDSTVLSHLVDDALPGNQIPRVYFNTGIEYTAMLKHVRSVRKSDPRVVIYNSGVNIQKMLKEVGYPFKSKAHSDYVARYQAGSTSQTVLSYAERRERNGKPTKLGCPFPLQYQFTPENTLKISSKCCDRLKKDTGARYAMESGRGTCIVGTRTSEGGVRSFHNGCTVFKDNRLKKFMPLSPVTDEWMEEYISRNDIELCSLYSQPYGMERTGCKGCPYNIHLQRELGTMEKYFPGERKQCEIIWGPVYKEYRRLGYRLRKDDPQMKLEGF